MSRLEIDLSIFSALLKLDECERARNTAKNLRDASTRAESARTFAAVDALYEFHLQDLKQKLAWKETQR